MRFNVNKPPKHIQRELDRKARREWHKKFAWKYTKVDKTDEGHRVVWFENYWRKEKIGPTNSSKDDGRYFEQYSEKEYFKKKLNGDFEERKFDGDEQEQDMSSIVTQIKNQMNKQHPSSGGIHKKGGPYSGVKLKKYVMGGDTISPGVTTQKYYTTRDENGYVDDIQTVIDDETPWDEDYEG